MDTQVRRYKNGLFNNISFMLLTIVILTFIISLIGSGLSWKAEYDKVNMVTGELDSYVIVVENLMTKEGIRYVIGNMVTNFALFTPLIYFIISTIAISVAYKAGYLDYLFRKVRKNFNRFWFTYVVSFIIIISTFAGDFGYYFLIPLAGILYLVNKRRPMIGVLVAFVSLASGSAIGLLTSSLDYSLKPYTQGAARLIDETNKMAYGSSIFFNIIATFLLAYVITYITEKIVVPHMPKYRLNDEEDAEIENTKLRKKGLKKALITSGIVLFVFVYFIIPGLPFSGLLLDDTGTTYFDQLFGANSYFQDGIIFVISLILLLSGYVYGKHARTIRTREEFTFHLYDSLNKVGIFFVILLIASQVIAIFRKSNLGIVAMDAMVDIIKALDFSSIPLIILLFIVAGLSNLFLVSSITKWSILSPVIVPMFMKVNITPEFTQLIYKLGETTTNMVTPLFPYLAIFLGYLALYHQEGELKVSDYYKMLFPYYVGISLLFIILVVVWYLVGLPLGINVFPTV